MHLTHELILLIQITRGRRDFNRDFIGKSSCWCCVMNLQPSDPDLVQPYRNWPFSAPFKWPVLWGTNLQFAAVASKLSGTQSKLPSVFGLEANQPYQVINDENLTTNKNIQSKEKNDRCDFGQSSVSAKCQKSTREKINDTDPKNIYSMLQPSHLQVLRSFTKNPVKMFAHQNVYSIISKHHTIK